MTHLPPTASGPMRVLERGVYRGPHVYSLRPMVHFTLDLGALEAWPTDRLPGFTDRMLDLLPGLRNHRCSYGVPGGLVRRLQEGTWLGHVTEHIALELQTLVGEAAAHGKTRSVRGQPGVYRVLYAYRDEQVAWLAGLIALRLVDSLLPPELQGVEGLKVLARGLPEAPPEGEPFALPAALDALRRLVRRTSLGPSTQALVNEARRRGIPVTRLDEHSLVQFGHGRYARRIRASITGDTSHLGVLNAGDKHRTKALLEAVGVPVPQGELARSAEEALEAAGRLGGPLVIKPLDGNHGRGVTLNLTDSGDVERAFERAAAQSRTRTAIIEQQLPGHDHRVLVVHGEVVAVAERRPAHVVGDGTRSIEALVAAVNADPRRGDGHENVLTRIALDAQVEARLAQSGRSLTSVPLTGEVVVLRDTANLSTGGSAVDRTDDIHPENASIARTAALAVGLDVAGIDLLAPDITRSVRESGGGVVEVNAAPGLRMHLQPTSGQPRDVARPILAGLYPPGAPSRVPILALTGTNGKSTTGRMVAHILTHAGHTVGLTNTSGVYVAGERIMEADATGPRSARMVLRHPLVTAAVLETARGGLLREGLGYDRADVGAVLNVQADHLGLRGVDTLHDLARVKSLLVRAVSRRGVSVLNADDPLVLRMRRVARGRLALFSLSGAAGEVMEAHIAAGGLAATREAGESGDEIVVYVGGERQVLMLTRDIPATLDGLALFNVDNALAACLMCLGQGIDPATIRAALTTFTASFEQNPGRLNFYDGLPFRVLLDYAHNPAGLEAQRQLLHQLRQPGMRLLGMVSIPGDRRDADIREVGAYAARTYDELVFREGPDGRGRPRGEVMALLQAGALAAGFPAERIHLALEERDAVDTTLHLARPGDLVAIMPTRVDEVWRQIQAFTPDIGTQTAPMPGDLPGGVHP